MRSQSPNVSLGMLERVSSQVKLVYLIFFDMLIQVLLWHKLIEPYICPQKDTEEEVKEHLRNNLHLQEKVMVKKAVS